MVGTFVESREYGTSVASRGLPKLEKYIKWYLYEKKVWKPLIEIKTVIGLQKLKRE